MIPKQMTFIGGGNMARSLISGLLNSGVPAGNVRVVDPDPAQRERMSHLGIATYAEATQALPGTELLILAVKPQLMAEVAANLSEFVQSARPLVVSIAAGIRCHDLARWLGGEVAIVRAMPNTPALVQCSATGLFANAQVNSAHRQQAESLMRSVGICLWVAEEAQLDAVTALSGSGPAYFFLMMEAMQAAGEHLGLDHRTAALLTVQTALGAAKMAMESQDPPAALRAQVTSPKGTTESALGVFEQHHYRQLVLEAMQAAHKRAQELADHLGAHA